MLDLNLTDFAVLVSIAFVTASGTFALLRRLGPDHTTADPAAQEPDPFGLPEAIAELETELDQLRAAVAHVPVLLWVQSADGGITWANKAYLDRADQIFPGQAGKWPLTRLFKATALSHPDAPGARRVPLETGTAQKYWFDIHAYGLDGDTLYAAIPIDMTVKAESSLRSFVQTLTSTFAHLQVGLAIFDKRRQLVLFNPALTDLTTLEPEWLSSRPSLSEFLDRLRDRNMLPEPRDYREWRARLTSLEAAAQTGAFEETWALATGQTLRIRARPHHDGGLAITMEDISSELSLTTRFRAEIELGQAVVDEVAPATVVFDDSGVMVMASAAYTALFGHSFTEELVACSLSDATALWQDVFEPSPIWGDLRDFGRTGGSRAAWEDLLHKRETGDAYRCRVIPLAQARTLVVFETVPPEAGLNPSLETGGRQDRALAV